MAPMDVCSVPGLQRGETEKMQKPKENRIQAYQRKSR